MDQKTIVQNLQETTAIDGFCAALNALHAAGVDLDQPLDDLINTILDGRIYIQYTGWDVSSDAYRGKTVVPFVRAKDGVNYVDNEFKIAELANSFSAILREWMTADEMEDINTQNESNGFNPSDCATHDHCDPNEAMIDAWDQVIARPFYAATWADTTLSDRAWQMAKENRFEQIKI
jgi:hypothetical protein